MIINIFSRRNFSRHNVFAFCAFGYWAVLLHIYQANMGGSGLNLPFNILAWSAVAIVILTICLWPFGRRFVRISSAACYFLLGSFFLSLLCLFTQPQWRYDAFLRAGAISGGGIFYLFLLQIKFNNHSISILLKAILCGVILECFIALIQFFHLPVLSTWWEFNDNFPLRTYAIFQQANVFASFLATGVAIAFWLGVFSNYRYRRNEMIIISFLLMLMGCVLWLCQSLSGYIAIFFVILYNLIINWGVRRRVLILCSALLCGMVCGFFIRFFNHIPNVPHISSSLTRWSILRNCLLMLHEKPLLGWGVGSFDYNYLHRFSGVDSWVGKRTISHPHNEIALWLVEGGIAGFLGISLIVLGGWQLITRVKEKKNLALLSLPIPIICHMMTEYPLYQSAPHWLLLILLLRCCDKPMIYCRFNLSICWGMRIITSAFSLVLLLLLINAYFLQYKLTYVERNSTQLTLPLKSWTEVFFQKDRYEYDYYIGKLMKFNETGNWDLLTQFQTWAKKYSLIHPDVNIYYSRLVIAEMEGDKDYFNELLSESKRLFPGEQRFSIMNAKQ